MSLDLLSTVWFEQDIGDGQTFPVGAVCPVVPLWSRLHIGESLVATNTGWRLWNDQAHFLDVAEVRPNAPAGKEISYCFSLFQ